MNILIVKLSAIGDVIHTLPSLAAIRRRYPQAHITWVVEQAASDLVMNHPLLDRTLVLSRKSWMADVKNGRIHSAWRGFSSFLAELQVRPYDLVIDFHGLLKSALVVLLSSGKRKLGYDSWQELSGLFYNEKIPEDMNKHAVERYLDFARYLGAADAAPEFVLPPLSDEREKQLSALLARHQLEDKKFIAVSPVALWDTKLWDDGKFAALADTMAQKWGLPIVFTGRDRSELERITASMTMSAVNLGGQTSLTQAARLYKKALTVVTTDSGPMHLAAAVGTPVVALFGPTDPARTGPYGTGHEIVRAGIDCSPCFSKKCQTRKCMEDIPPQQVLNAVEIIIQRELKSPLIDE